MCGIAGLVSYERKIPETALLHKMANTIAHRGPDAEGIYTAAHVGLAQRRLSIIDLTDNANPPLSNEDGSIWIVFNGEIYNFPVLREELIRNGHIFKTKSDTEVLIHLYEEMGTDMLERIVGMFAFAIWDDRHKRLFAARDRLGEKPLVYARTDRFFAFGSAIRAITAIPEVSREPNYTAIDSYLTLRYVPSPATAFTAISKLPAGHALVCDISGSFRVFRYWAPPTVVSRHSIKDRTEICENIESLLGTSVRERLLADVPVGALLSGGIDSGLVVAHMAKLSSRPVKTFTIGFGDPQRDELDMARLVAKRFATDHSEIVVTPDIEQLLPELAHQYNEPFADSSAIPSYYVSKAARAEVTVALSGDGGDESFSGYNRYGEIESWSRADLLPRFFKQPMVSAGRAMLRYAPRSNFFARADRALMMVGGHLPQRYALTMALLKPQEKQDLYSRAFPARVEEEHQSRDNFWRDDMDPINWMSREDQLTYLPDCLMVKMDVASMANGLEVRAPLLDHKLVEFAASIPGHLKRRAGRGKALLRDIAAKLLPSELLQKPKTGFDIPVAKWLRFDLHGVVRQYLLDDISRRRNLFEQSAIARIVTEHETGKRDWSNRLWTLLMLEIWFREVVD
jgi:asparagine synthase (glutamine-hydrolysing)